MAAYPCFISDAWARDFERWAIMVGHAVANCGDGHGQVMAAHWAHETGHDEEALLRIGRAKARGEA